jgi:hypothetical protein
MMIKTIVTGTRPPLRGATGRPLVGRRSLLRLYDGRPAGEGRRVYERQTGKKGIRNEGGWSIAVKGSSLFPELGIMVQPNAGTHPPAVKTRRSLAAT